MKKFVATNSNAWNRLRDEVSSREIPPGITSAHVIQALQVLGLAEASSDKDIVSHLSDSEVNAVMATVSAALGNPVVRLVQ